MDINRIKAIAREHESFYVYDENRIENNISALKRCFAGADILYSIKCNPNKGVLKAAFSRGLGADAASAGEVEAALDAGLEPENIFYSSPGKTDEDILSVLRRCTIIADSLSEVRRIDELLTERNERADIGIRINPNFSFDSSAPAPSKFGADENAVFDFMRHNACNHARIKGIHVHLKSQETNAEALAGYHKNVLNLAERFADEFGEPDFVNMGSGIGASLGGSALDMDLLGAAAKESFSRFRQKHPSTRLMVESGRYIVCSAGTYVAHVADKKVSLGKTYVILTGTLNAFLRPALARLIMKYSISANPAGSEPLFSGADAFEFIAPYDDRPIETVTLAGNVCTACDIVAEDIELPRLERGDIVLISNAGSYAAVLSPNQFSFQRKAEELFLSKSGNIE